MRLDVLVKFIDGNCVDWWDDYHHGNLLSL